MNEDQKNIERAIIKNADLIVAAILSGIATVRNSSKDDGDGPGAPGVGGAPQSGAEGGSTDTVELAMVGGVILLLFIAFVRRVGGNTQQIVI